MHQLTPLEEKLNNLLINDSVAVCVNGIWYAGIMRSLYIEGVPCENGYIPNSTEVSIEVNNSVAQDPSSEDGFSHIFLPDIQDIQLIERGDNYVKIFG